MRNAINPILGAILAVLLLLALFARPDHSRPNFQIQLGDDMTYAPSYGAYDPNPNFADGRTFQDPVPGTIARGELPLHFAATPADALRAGEELQNPIDPQGAAAHAAVMRGAASYKIFCTPCHGGTGLGDGPVAKRGFPPPPSLLTGKSVQMKDGQLFHILTFGQNTMPSFAAQLRPIDRWEVVAFIRSLQQQTPSTPPAEPAKSDTQP